MQALVDQITILPDDYIPNDDDDNDDDDAIALLLLLLSPLNGIVFVSLVLQCTELTCIAYCVVYLSPIDSIIFDVPIFVHARGVYVLISVPPIPNHHAINRQTALRRICQNE